MIRVSCQRFDAEVMWVVPLTFKYLSIPGSLQVCSQCPSNLQVCCRLFSEAKFLFFCLFLVSMFKIECRSGG